MLAFDQVTRRPASVGTVTVLLLASLVALARYTASGGLDGSFGVNGRAGLDVADLPGAKGHVEHGPNGEVSVDGHDHGPILRNTLGTRMDRHAATRRLKHLAETAGIRMPHMLRHTFVTTMLDAGVDLRDVQIAARHADPRTTMRYDRARKNLDRHPNYILAAFMASGT